MWNNRLALIDLIDIAIVSQSFIIFCSRVNFFFLSLCYGFYIPYSTFINLLLFLFHIGILRFLQKF